MKDHSVGRDTASWKGLKGSSQRPRPYIDALLFHLDRTRGERSLPAGPFQSPSANSGRRAEYPWVQNTRLAGRLLPLGASLVAARSSLESHSGGPLRAPVDRS